MGEEQQTDEKIPAPDGFETWNTCWTEQGMPWRVEGPISTVRAA